MLRKISGGCTRGSEPVVVSSIPAAWRTSALYELVWTIISQRQIAATVKVTLRRSTSGRRQPLTRFDRKGGAPGGSLKNKAFSRGWRRRTLSCGRTPSP